MTRFARAGDWILHWGSLVITDRRWAAPLIGMALGFGLFIGVAVGPRAGGSQASGGPMVVEVVAPDEPRDQGAGGNQGAAPAAPPGGGGPSSGGLSSGLPTTTPAVLPPAVPLAPAPAEPPAETQTAPSSDSSEDPEVPADEGQTLAGTAAHVNPAAGSYTLAAAGGALYSIHSKKPPSAGVKLKVPVRQLANGTYAEDGEVTTTGHEATVVLAGTVSFVDDSAEASAYTLSAPGVSVLVRVDAPADGSAAELPEVGAFGTVSAEIEKAPAATTAGPPAEPPAASEQATTATTTTTPPTGCEPDPALEAATPVEAKTILRQREFEADGEPSTYSDFEGIVSAVCPESGQMLISADDLRQAGEDLTFSVPAEIDPALVKPGESVAATATIEEDGSLTISGLASDEKIAGADDSGRTQGDLDRG